MQLYLNWNVDLMLPNGEIGNCGQTVFYMFVWNDMYCMFV